MLSVIHYAQNYAGIIGRSLALVLISGLDVANLFMHSLPGMILLYLAVPFTLKVFLHEIVYTGNISITCGVLSILWNKGHSKL